MKTKTGKMTPCKHCGELFYLPRWQAEKGGKYCSHSCHSRDLVKPRVSVVCSQCGSTFLARQQNINIGRSRVCSQECKIKSLRDYGLKYAEKVRNHDESLQSRWKGDKVGYFGVHDWMTKHYGQPIGCEECGTTDPNKTYGWANISREYKRDRSDFKRMCMSCHRKFDGAGKKAWATFLKRKSMVSA